MFFSSCQETNYLKSPLDNFTVAPQQLFEDRVFEYFLDVKSNFETIAIISLKIKESIIRDKIVDIDSDIQIVYMNPIYRRLKINHFIHEPRINNQKYSGDIDIEFSIEPLSSNAGTIKHFYGLVYSNYNDESTPILRNSNDNVPFILKNSTFAEHNTYFQSNLAIYITPSARYLNSHK